MVDYAHVSICAYVLVRYAALIEISMLQHTPAKRYPLVTKAL